MAPKDQRQPLRSEAVPIQICPREPPARAWPQWPTGSLQSQLSPGIWFSVGAVSDPHTESGQKVHWSLDDEVTVCHFTCNMLSLRVFHFSRVTVAPCRTHWGWSPLALGSQTTAQVSLYTHMLEVKLSFAHTPRVPQHPHSVGAIHA